MKKGYTLVEMMVVIALLTMIGVGMVAMFLSTARNGGKAGAVALVKAEADYAITTMERYIHFAKDVTCTSGVPNAPITIKQVDGTLVTFSSTGTKIQRGGSDITSDKVAISTTDPLTFTCVKSPNGYWTVDIKFGMGTVTGDVANEIFHTKVVLRNKAQ